MSEEIVTSEQNLKPIKIVLRFFGAGLTIFFIFFWLITAFDSPLIAVGGPLEKLNWPPGSHPVELMLYSIYIVWGVYMWRAASDPKRWASFIDFTIWANVAHAAFMVAYSLIVPGFIHHLYTDVGFLVVVIVALAWTRPKELRQFSS